MDSFAKDDDSELDHFSCVLPILKTLLRDINKKSVKFVRGKNASKCSRVARRMNDEEFGQQFSCRSSCGWKVDLLITDIYGHKLSAHEWKKGSASSTTLLAQQTNSLRVNKCILHGLSRSFRGDSLSILAMDWKGSNGYMYELKKADVLFRAKFVKLLILPQAT